MALQRSHSAEALTDEKLERVFREIEEASERRAREEEVDSFPSHTLVSTLSNGLSNVDSEKKRRRASISISRIGNYGDLGQSEQQSTQSGAASPVPWGPLYSSQTRTTSTASLSSDSSISSALRHIEEENLTTQKETIIGRRNTLTKAVSSALARTLTRMRSRGALDEVSSADEAMVIGVAVHEATTTANPAGTEADKGAISSINDAELGMSTRASGSRSRSGTVPGQRPKAEVHTEVSALVAAEAPAASSTRSRSGSINKLRAKRVTVPGLRGQGAEARQLQTPPPPPEPQSRVPAPISVSKRTGHSPEGVRSPSSMKTPRIRDLARAIAQRLRRRPSAEESESGGGNNSSSSKVKKAKDKAPRRPKGIRRTHSASNALQLDGQVNADGRGVESAPGALPRTSSDPALPLIPMLPLPTSLHPRPSTAPEPSLNPASQSRQIDPVEVPLPASLPASPLPPSSQKTDSDAGEVRSTLSGLATQPASPELAPITGLGSSLEISRLVPEHEAPQDEDNTGAPEKAEGELTAVAEGTKVAPDAAAEQQPEHTDDGKGVKGEEDTASPVVPSESSEVNT